MAFLIFLKPFRPHLEHEADALQAIPPSYCKGAS